MSDASSHEFHQSTSTKTREITSECLLGLVWNPLEFADEINRISNLRGQTKIGTAVRAATAEFVRYGRREVVRLMIVLTDGISNDDELGAAKNAR